MGSETTGSSCPDNDHPDTSEYGYVGLIMLALFEVYFILSLNYYILRRRNNEYLQRRNLPLVLINAFGFNIQFVTVAVRDFVGLSEYNCALFILSLFSILMTGVWPLIVRGIGFERRVKYSLELSQDGFDKALKNPYGNSISDDVRRVEQFRRSEAGESMASISQLDVTNLRSSISESEFSGYSNKKNCTLFTHSVAEIFHEDLLECCGCKNSNILGLYLYFGFIGISMVFLFYVLVKLRHEPDYYGVAREIKTVLLAGLVTYGAWTIGVFYGVNDDTVYVLSYLGMFTGCVMFSVLVPLQIYLSNESAPLVITLQAVTARDLIRATRNEAISENTLDESIQSVIDVMVAKWPDFQRSSGYSQYKRLSVEKSDNFIMSL